VVHVLNINKMVNDLNQKARSVQGPAGKPASFVIFMDVVLPSGLLSFSCNVLLFGIRSTPS